jgi:hypothetical protein
MHQPIDTPVGGETDALTGQEFIDSLKDAQGRFRTQSLFIETPHESYPAYFTIKKYDFEKGGKTYISMYRKYMEYADPTEYNFAQMVLGSWDHWLAMQRNAKFREHLVGWREELRIKIESARYHEMVKAAKQGKTTASEWLAKRYGEGVKRGRPSKAEKAAHLKRIEQDSEEVKEDVARLGL